MRPLNKKIDINTGEKGIPIILKSSKQLYFRLVSLFASLFLLNACSLDVSIMDMAQYAGPVKVKITAPEKVNTTSSSNISVDLNFSAPFVGGIKETDLLITGGTIVPGSLSGSGKNYTVMITPDSNLGLGSHVDLMEISFPSKNVTIIGNYSDLKKVTTAESAIVLIDKKPPTAQITTDVLSPTTSSSIVMTLSFDEPVRGLEIGDFEIREVALLPGVGGASITSAACAQAPLENEACTIYSLSITPGTSAEIEITLKANSVTDLAGNLNFRSNSLSVVYDINRPSPSLSLGTTLISPTNIATIPINISFLGSDITGLDISDFTTNDATLSSLSGSGSSYILNLTPTIQEGVVNIRLPAGAVANALGTTNFQSNLLNILVDYVAPSILISGPDKSSGDSATEFIWTVSYSDFSQITLDASNVSFNSSGVSCLTKTVTAGPDTGSRLITVGGCASDGAVSVTLASGTARDVAGNLAPAVNTSNSATILNSSPTLVIENANYSTGNSSTVFSWSIGIAGASSLNISASNITLSGATAGCGVVMSGSGLSARLVTVTGCTGSGTLNFSVAAGVATGPTGKASIVTNSPSVEITNPPVWVSFKEASSTIDRDIANQTFQIELSQVLPVDTTVSYKLTGSTTAENPSDYNLQSGNIVIPAGQTLANINYHYNSSDSFNVVQMALRNVSADGFNTEVGTKQIHRRLVYNTAETSQTFKSVAIGSSHVCGVLNSGVLKCWGQNYYGQLGDNTTVDKLDGVVVDSGVSYKSIAAGQEHTCGITMTGALKCWGRGQFGRLGDGDTVDRLTPVIVDSGVNYKSITAGSSHTCGITDSGVLKCWGNQGSGRLGIGPLTPVTSPTPIDSGVVYDIVSAGNDHTCGITDLGVLKCWGGNFYGQVGDTTNANKLVPTIINSGVAYKRIAAGSNMTCAITSLNALKCWGQNTRFQVSAGVTLDSRTPVVINNGFTYSSISLGSSVCGITDNDNLKCWGDNYYGQIGDGTKENRLTPVGIDIVSKYTVVVAGYMKTCGITQSGILKCWGHATAGALAQDAVELNTISTTTEYKDIDSGQANTCGVTTSGVLHCWGEKVQLNDTISSVRTAPIVIDKASLYSNISIGNDSHCGITPSGTLKCWGENLYGQLGDGTTVKKSNPTVIDSGVSYKQVFVNEWHSCGITVEGRLKCWGLNNFGQLGTGNDVSRTSPVTIDSSVSYKKVSLGNHHTCGITEDGVLKCWGRNDVGQLGTGTTTDSFLLRVIDVGTKYTDIYINASRSCGITELGVLKCWGNNSLGSLGVGDTTSRPSPTVVNAGTSYKSIVMGRETCGITTAGVLKCWGIILSDRAKVSRTSPVVVNSGTVYQKVSIDDIGTICGITSGGIIQCWGRGQLGDGTLADWPSPVKP